MNRLVKDRVLWLSMLATITSTSCTIGPLPTRGDGASRDAAADPGRNDRVLVYPDVYSWGPDAPDVPDIGVDERLDPDLGFNFPGDVRSNVPVDLGTGGMFGYDGAAGKGGTFGYDGAAGKGGTFGYDVALSDGRLFGPDGTSGYGGRLGQDGAAGNGGTFGYDGAAGNGGTFDYDGASSYGGSTGYFDVDAAPITDLLPVPVDGAPYDSSSFGAVDASGDDMGAAIDSLGTSVPCGPQWSDMTWTKSASPYVIDCTVQIPTGVTLTIEPGVTVAYAGAYSIEVHGALIANGTASDPITFTSTSPGTNSDATAIVFTDATNLDLSAISQAVFEWGLAGIGIATTVGNIAVGHCRFSYNLGTVISGPLGNLTVDSSVFDSNGQIMITAGAVYGATVTNSTFTHNRGAFAVVAGQVSNCTFTGNDGAVKGGTVTNSRFADNGSCNADSAQISYSTFTSTTGTGTAVCGTSTVTYSEISGYAVGVEGAPTDFHNNNIHDNGYNFRVTGSADISAANNWWGTTDTGAISTKIWDYYDDINLGRALYTPILTAPEPTAGAY